MKKLTIIAASAVIALTSCGTLGTTGLSTAGSVLGALTGNSTASTVASAASTGSSILGALVNNATSGSNLTNILTSVIGLDKASTTNLYGTWYYSQPGCAFTSQSTLANAGGEVVAATVKQKLATYYNTLGFKSNNTQFTFNQNGTYTATLHGKSLSGNYTFDESTQAITMNITLLGVSAYTLQGYVKKNSDGIALLFESKKILTILQTLGALSGNSTVSNITSLTSNYDGVRIGFDLKQ